MGGPGVVDMPEFRLEGDEYLYVWHEPGVGVKFSQLRKADNSQAIRGFIDVYSIRPDSPAPGSQWWNRIDLTTQSDRNRTIEQLKKLTHTESNKEAWSYEVNWIYQDCARRFITAPPACDLADEEDGENSEDLEPQYLFAPIALLNQLNLFLADQGSTKSYLLLYMAVCLVTGISSIFGAPRVKGPVVYFDWEVDRSLQKRRLRLICRGLGIPIPRGIHYVNMSEAGSIMDSARDMRQQIAKAGAVAAIIDSLTFGAGGDLNSPEIGSPTARALGSLGNNVTKLVATHPPKSSRRSAEGNTDDVSVIGSGLFEFRARSIYVLRAPPRHTRGEEFVVTMKDRKLNESGANGEVYYTIHFDNLEHKVTLERTTQAAVAAAAVDSQVSGRDAMLQALARGPLNTSQLAIKLKVDTNTIRSWGSRLFKDGLINKLNKGADEQGVTQVWALPPEPAIATKVLPF